jgi:hypothetical protein
MPTKEAPAEAEIALAISECMNLLFLFAAPRVLTAVRRSGGAGLDGPASVASLRRFLHQAAGIRARTTTHTDDVDRLVRAAMVVEEIAGAMGASAFSDPLPIEITERARKALAILGFEEPTGGWDEFEGFSVPYPPPSPRLNVAR